jgi:hypothetical protein
LRSDDDDLINLDEGTMCKRHYSGVAFAHGGFYRRIIAILEYLIDSKMTGGRGGIRTPDTLSGTPVFKTGAINHSATLPM